MQCEIVMIGTELLLGQIVDTNAAFMGQVLAENGFPLYQKSTVGDNADRIRNVLDLALSRSDVVLCSGGLGPTEDDITRECVAELLGRPLEFRQELYEELLDRFAHLKISITENNRKQAFAPKGAIAVKNPNGTAPGLIVDDPRGIVACMPGVPWELKPMLTDSIIPYLREKFGMEGVIHSRVLKVCGVGESRIDAAIGDLITAGSNPTIGLLAGPEAVRIRITARAESLPAAERLIDAVDARVRERLPGLVMGVNDDTIEGVVDRLLSERGWTLALSETATGGMAAQRLTVARAQCLAGGLVVPISRIDGENLPAVAEEMSEKARAHYAADCGLALVTDYPGKRTFVHFVAPTGSAAWEIPHWGSGERFQLRVAVLAFEHIRRHLTNVTV